MTLKIKMGEIIVNVPSRRKDISIKEDLIEEVARIYAMTYHQRYLYLKMLQVEN